MSPPSISPESFQIFGELLKFLRRRERLTQLELSIAVGYSEAQIGRLEQNQRRPDLSALKALFIPALHLENEPELTARFLQLAQSARQEDAPEAGIAPYKGLLFFDRADSDLFFGRETLTMHMADRVTDLAMDASTRFLAVVGASGSGKSSLLRAGLAATLQQTGWKSNLFTPTVHPLKILAANYDPSTVSDNTRHLVLVDQFEETFTHCRDDHERSEFIEGLLSIARDPLIRTTVVIALRADFYPHCAQYPLLREAVATNQEYIGQMTKTELRRAIEEPARRGGWEFEPGLVEILLNDVGADGMGQPEPGALPLLSHALLATWERRRGRILNIQGYRVSGGVRGAIAETAESVFTDQLDGRQQDLAHDIFLRLTELGEGTEDTRRRATLKELVRQSEEAGQLRAVLNTLAEARLITLNEDSVEVAHEALIREWQRLHEWLTQDREGLRLHRHLTNSAHEWEARGRDAAELYRGARLAQTREWASAHLDILNALESAFLDGSVKQEQDDVLEREAQHRRELKAAQELAKTQSRAAKQLRRRAVFLSGALVLAIMLAGVAIFFGDQANRNAVKAQNNAEIAQQNAASANTSKKQAESETSIATSRELAAAAVSDLGLDPQLSILLSLQAIKTSITVEAENALHRSILASRVVFTMHHEASVWTVAYSPDGKRIATASADKTAKIWDAATGKLLLTLVGHTDSVHVIAFSPDGKHLATASDDHTAKIWDAATGKELFTLSGHQDIVFSVAYSPDGRLVATAGTNDRTVRIWDAGTGQLKQVLQYPAPLLSVAFSPDGTRLATGTGPGDNASPGRVVIWEMPTGKEQFELSLGTSENFPSEDFPRVTFSPDGTRVAAAAEFVGLAIVWDLNTHRELARFHQATGVEGVAFSPDGKWLAASGTDQTGNIYDLASGAQLYSLTGSASSVLTVAFSPDGTRLATGSDRGIASVWDLTPTWELLYIPALAKDSLGVSRMAFSPDGKHIVANQANHTTKVWEVSSGAELPLAGPAGINTLFTGYRPDGRLIQVGIQDGTAMVIDPQTGSTGPVLSGPVETTGGFTLSLDGTRFVNYKLDSTISVWDLRSGRQLSSFKGDVNGSTNLIDCIYFGAGSFPCMAFSPDGQRLVTSDADTRTHNQLDSGGTNSSWDTSATVWDAASGQRLLALPAHIGTIWDLSFSPDGSRVVTVGDRAADVWDAVTGKLILTLSSATSSLYQVKFSPDGKEIGTYGGDGAVRLWDAFTGANLLTLPSVLTRYSSDLAFSPDGKNLAVADAIGIHIFVLPIDDVVALARSRLTRLLTTAECQEYLHVDVCPTDP